MGLNNEFVGTPVVIDLETIAHETAGEFLPPPDLDHIAPPSNYKKQDAIDDYMFREKVKRQTDYKEDLERCSLDPDLCRIVAIGFMRPAGVEPTVLLCRSEADEAQALALLWNCIKGAQLVGYNIAGFDVPVLLRRSLLLDIKAPDVQVGKWRHPTITDLMQLCSFDGLLKWRGQKFYIKRFGLDVEPDPYVGADIAGLVASGDWTAITNHVRADVLASMALARRLGVVPPKGV